MKKILLIGVFILFLFGFYLLFSNIHQDNISIDLDDNFERIDTGITPEQTWRIIYGEDVGEVLNLRKTKQ